MEKIFKMLEKNLRFNEDPLPQKQSFIPLENAILAQMWLTTVYETQRGTINLLHGPSGSGKTTTLNNFSKTQPKDEGTGKDTVLLITVIGKPTLQEIVQLILEGLGVTQKVGNTKPDFIRAASKALIMHGIKMVIIDEAEQLNLHTLDYIRSISDRTHCHFVLCGLPSIKRMFHSQEKIRNRIRFEYSYKPVEKTEFMKTLLPNCAHSRWSFNPNDPDDLDIGEYLWGITGPSLRKLYFVLDTANSYARNKDVEKIGISEIKGGKTLLYEGKKLSREERVEQNSGPYERESKKRQDRRSYGKQT